jgi:hyperosmotically inducible periplasmic protein
MSAQNTFCEAEGNCVSSSSDARNLLIAGVSLAAGAAIGAVAMYFFDPNRGKVRRALVQDGTISTVRKGTHAAAGKAEDLLNRAKGVIAKAGDAVTWKSEVDDNLLADRVRSHMGHITKHAHSVETEVKGGKVTLRGILPDAERQRLIPALSSIPGVKSVQDCLACLIEA